MSVWAFVLSLAYYPYYLGFLAWFALVRPLWIISKLEKSECFKASYFFSFCYVLFTLYWVGLVTPPGMLAAVVIVGFYYTAILTAYSKLHRIKPIYGIIFLPFLWTGLEHFRTLSQFAFPWSDIGYTQAHYLYILQNVSVISLHGLSFLIIVVNLLVLQLFRSNLSAERRITCGFSALAIVAALIAYGWIETPPLVKEGTVKVGILQGSVPIDIKWELENEGFSIKRYDTLTKSIQAEKPSLIVWPESGAPCFLDADLRCRESIVTTVKESGVPHLIGALAVGQENGERRDYNSCFQFDPDGRIVGRYDKTKLVPFSEHVPYEKAFPFLRADLLVKYLTFIRNYNVQWWSDFAVGDSLHLFKIPEGRYGVLICFESAFPDVARQMILDGAEFIVGITNDTWFGSTVGIHMHSSIFITRAVENRCWMARAANSGLSYVVDPYGRIHEQIPHDAVQAFTGKVGLLSSYSVFTRIGDVAGKVSFFVMTAVLFILVAGWIGQRFFKRSF
ncbi:MAG: apolipoprotein N-acyltransferase [Candidatus Zixiibacteriota bacterium]